MSCTYSASIPLLPRHHHYNTPLFFKLEFSPSVVHAGNNIDEPNNNIELSGNAIIDANEKLLKLIAAITSFVETFLFGKDCLMVKIQTIENCKTKILTWMSAYAKLAIHFFENKSWQESN